MDTYTSLVGLRQAVQDEMQQARSEITGLLVKVNKQVAEALVYPMIAEDEIETAIMLLKEARARLNALGS